MAQLEFKIIQQYFNRSELAFNKVGIDLGIGDDCALLSPGHDKQLAISTDLLVEKVHFPEGADPRLVAHRALAVNLSDLAAMGADPVCFTLGLSLPDPDPHWLEGFSNGLVECARLYDCPLVGGDLVKGSLIISIQVHGHVPNNSSIQRSGATPGDGIYVTGYLGDAAIALDFLQGRLEKNLVSDLDYEYLLKSYYNPEPRIKAGIALRNIASSCIDISDGLMADLGHLCKASKVGAQIDLPKIPLSQSALAIQDRGRNQSAAMSGGDDYELCFTVSPGNRKLISNCFKELEVSCTQIGEIIAGENVEVFDENENRVVFDSPGYSHFLEIQ